MVPVDRSQVPLRVVLGCCCLLACLGGVSLGAPAYQTAISEAAPSEAAMAASLDAYSPAEIDSTAFATLSSAEQTAVRGAIDSAAGVYTDRGRSADGDHLTYRNDIISHRFVGYEGSIYLVRTVIDVGYLSLGGSILVGSAGFALIGSGLRRRRHSGV